MIRAKRLQRLAALAATQEQVVSRRQLYGLGVTRWQVKANVRAQRWQLIGTQSVCLYGGPLADPSRLWAALFEAGPRALLDGASALIAGGLRNFDEDSIRVSVPKGARVRRARGVNIRETRRWQADDVVEKGVPRTRPPVAAVRGALWAKSDRAAALIMTMTVQQGLCRAEDIGLELLRIKRDRRRPLLHAVLIDLLGGIRSLGELDVVCGCRRRGIPEPDKQVLRRTPTGNYYLDFRWERWKVVLEVDGIQHGWVENAVGDALRHNTIAMSGDVVLRLPVLGLRVSPDAFFEQLATALRNAGCDLPRRKSA